MPACSFPVRRLPPLTVRQWPGFPSRASPQAIRSLALRYDFTSIRLSRGLTPRAVEHARNTKKRPAEAPVPQERSTPEQHALGLENTHREPECHQRVEHIRQKGGEKSQV